jgi:hypothetical protein
MRGHALTKGYSLNEHGISKVVNKTQEEKVTQGFNNEKDIFDFLGLVYKEPIERVDGRSVFVATTASPKKSTTIKIKAAIKQPTIKIMEEVKAIEKTGFGELDKLSQADLEALVQKANDAYYNQNPIMTDNEFDIVKELLERKFPKSETLSEIGAPVKKDKATLPYEMASMDKIKPDTGALAAWTSKYLGPDVLSCKLDGVSGLYSTEGDVPKLYTRGNGIIGQDVSHLIKVLNLPKHKGYVVRGEFIIPKKVFDDKYKEKFALTFFRILKHVKIFKK